MQDLVKSYKQFITSYYVTDGLRITAAIMIPIILSYFYGDIRMGVTIALGALCITICDSPGPLHHRVNGMLIGIALVFVIALLTGFSVNIHWLIAIELFIFSFIFSMAGIYGARATSIGISALLIMILNINDHYTTKEIVLNALYILTGGLWYFLWSVALNRLRPYKLAQQAIGDSILSTARYMRLKGALYSKNVKYDECYTALIDEQVQLHNKQNLVREVLFKTRSIVKDSTHKGRTLLAIFNDAVDLFEQIMTTQHDYKLLHQLIDEELLSAFEKTIITVASELEDVGIAMQEGKKSIQNPEVEKNIAELEIYFNNYRKKIVTDENIEALISLHHVLENIKTIHNRILIMHRYTAYDPKFTAKVDSGLDYNKFVSTTEVNPQLFIDNLTLRSNIFRHSIRVSITMLVGYFSLRLLSFGHDYWILLTILVILKPAYSLTKQRNIHRLLGTLIGAAIGAVLLYFIKEPTVLLIIMIIIMAAAYSLMRINYLPFVVLMTIYLLISFYLLKAANFNVLISDRIIDTAIGSALAFIATFLIPPRWEKEQMESLVQNAVTANALYFQSVAAIFTGEGSDPMHIKLLRKDAYVAMANLSDAFQRMLSEPQNKQEKSVQIYSLVVFNHLLLSHISTLASYEPLFSLNTTAIPVFKPVIKNTLHYLQNEEVEIVVSEKFVIHDQVKSLMKLEKLSDKPDQPATDEFSVKTITDQFLYIQKIAMDIHGLKQA